MKLCENCAVEIDGKDGENLCQYCDAMGDSGKALARKARRERRREREAALRDCGLVKVRGALGGTYWE